MLFRSLLVILLCGLAAGSAQGQIRRESEIHARLARESLNIYPARGPENACGPGCREWIAIEGQFDKDSAKRVTAFLDALKARDLPVFLNSTGGLTDEGIAVGRALRARGLRAGVGATEPNCSGQSKEACRRLKQGGQTVEAVLTQEKARCSSACVFAWIGATERLTPLDGSVGIHSTAYFCFLKNGRVMRPVGNSKDAIDCRKKIATQKDQLARYIQEMGVSGDFIQAMNRVPSSQIRFLSRSELTQYGISHREARKHSGAQIDEGSSSPE